MKPSPVALLAVFSALLAACPGRGRGTVSDAAQTDAFAADIVHARDANVDAVVPVCSQAEFTFAPGPISFHGDAPFPCGNAQWIVFGRSEARHTCFRAPWLYSAQGTGVRVLLDGGALQGFLGWRSQPPGVVACQSSGLVLGLGEYPALCESIFTTPDLSQPAVRLWSHEEPGATRVGVSIDNLVATDQLIAWVASDIGYHLFVAGPHGENPRNLNIPLERPPAYLAADGAHLVFWSGGDIWLWTVGTDAPEDLTPDPADQWAPWISGNRVVWVDQRDTPTGSLWNPDNPEIYTMDLTTRVPQRITHDPPDHPAVQQLPVIQGDWVVWMDTRNAMAPNAGYLTDQMEIWGYHFATGRQYPIVAGAIRAYDPTIVAGQVVFTCTAHDDSRTGTFIAPFPDPYAPPDGGTDASVDAIFDGGD